MNSALPSATPDLAPVWQAFGDVAGTRSTRRVAAYAQPVERMIDGHRPRTEGLHAREANQVLHSAGTVEDDEGCHLFPSRPLTNRGGLKTRLPSSCGRLDLEDVLNHRFHISEFIFSQPAPKNFFVRTVGATADER
jgi:hypothetical protein